MQKHYTKILIILFFSLKFSYVNAQFVYIPDTNFVNYLNTYGFSSCMNGNMMDITCPDVINAIALSCYDSNIEDLTGLQYFVNLRHLDCHHNLLQLLPPLPDSLVQLLCYDNVLYSLPALPNTLAFFDCGGNPLMSLPPLPNSLYYFNVSNCLVDSLPSLPNSLYNLDCNTNPITNLPQLPNNLTFLNCTNNLLVSLPSLPQSLQHLVCSNNQLTSIPALPPVLSTLWLQNNPNLNCLPELTSIYDFRFSNTAIQCLPNYGTVAISNPPLSNFPLCDIFNSTCIPYWNISGKAYSDTNNNCIADGGEMRLQNLKLELDSAGVLLQQTYTGGEGFYSFDTDTGTYIYTVDTTGLSVMVTCPAAGYHTSVFTSIDSLDYDMDFGMQCKPGFDAGVITVARDSGIFRPAHFAKIKISAGDISNLYGLHCASGTSGSVQVVFNGAASYIGASPGSLTPVVSGDTLLYSIADFDAVNFNSDFSFVMQTDTAALIHSQVCFDVSVFPLTGDINMANNHLQHCFIVVNGIDPNIQEVFPSGNLDTTQQWLTYTINFQNTGTATAQHIYILDTLDNNFDESTFTLLSYSHMPLTQVIGNAVRFNFPNINLPDSTTNEPASHGYVQFKVKLKNGLPVGTTIQNTANIIFDFNAPISTNTVINQIQSTTGIISQNEKENILFEVSPNPVMNHQIKIVYLLPRNKEGIFEIFDVNGRKVYSLRLPHWSTLQQINLPNLSNGLYNCVITSENFRATKKIAMIKE